MAFALDDFARLRPFLFHATRKENLSHLLKTLELLSASKLGCGSDIRKTDNLTVNYNGHKLFIGDQQPLNFKNIELENGWAEVRYLQSLNERVFFFPSATEEIPSSCTTFIEAKGSRSVTMIVAKTRTEKIFKANNPSTIEFCKYNSGSARKFRGHPIKRGSRTFLNCQVADFKAHQVKEVTFVNLALLPADTVFGPPWK